jgi:hypothetical protein
LSHSKERAEKICLNCGANLYGRYCHACGQENTMPRESVWGLVSHFFNDITHFDGKFFSTAKYLITRPGFLSQEYIKGRRNSYLHPIRMYVFTAGIFFIVFFWLTKSSLQLPKDDQEQLKESVQAADFLKTKIPDTKDSILRTAMERALLKIDRHAQALQWQIANTKKADSLEQLKRDSKNAKTGIHVDPLSKDPVVAFKIYKNPDPVHMDINDVQMGYPSAMAYDSVQKELPQNKRDNWYNRLKEQKLALLNTKWKGDKKEGILAFMEKILHTIPQAVFISLPVFALLLLLLYGNKRFFYSEHGIFTIHYYCAGFVFMLGMVVFKQLSVITGWAWPRFFELLLMLGIFFYLYKAMRRFYGQRRAITIFKFLGLNILALLVVLILVVGIFMLSLVQFS